MNVRLVQETNLYAEQCQAAISVQDSAWKERTVEEMRAYIGLNILMGFHQLPEIDHYWTSFARRYRPGKELSIDEAMVAFKGRSFMKKYLPAKPIKWGFKVWTIAETRTECDCGIHV